MRSLTRTGYRPHPFSGERSYPGGMHAQRVHLVRHGEVDNPNGVLYERLDGFGLSEAGHRMAALAAADLAARGVQPAAVVVSPLLRTRQSAAPILEAFRMEPTIDDRVIEPWNVYAGKRLRNPGSCLRDPREWRHLVNPFRPSWGEPYRDTLGRMRVAILDHAARAAGRDIIVVTHQLPIWLVHLRLAQKPLIHNPRGRRCALSSITEFEFQPGAGLCEVGYREPAAAIAARDQGAV